MFECRTPKNQQEFDQYYFLRWKILREPLQQKLGSEKDELESQSIHRAIFDNSGNVIAIARLHYINPVEAQIRYMAVSADYQGKGLGHQVISILEQHAIELGIKKISLKSREAVQGFYERQGYQNLGFSHLLYNQVRHFLMEKEFTPNNAHLEPLSTELQHIWHKTIPLSKAMNIAIGYYDRKKLVTSCDVGFNKNLHNTMFAGSVYTLATLTGWGWVHLWLQQEEVSGDIVLADANIRYHSPIENVAFAETDCSLNSGDYDKLRLKEKAKFTIEVKIKSGDKVAATFKGLYFVLPK
jgi:thioesterase domain-containing protein